MTALKNTIEEVFTQGMSQLYDQEQMELQKLNALHKQIAIEEENLSIQRIQNRQRQSEQVLKQIRQQRQELMMDQLLQAQSLLDEKGARLPGADNQFPTSMSPGYRGQPMELY